jgi:hypothetical protein
VDGVQRDRVGPLAKGEYVATTPASPLATLDLSSPTTPCHAEQRRTGQAGPAEPEEVTAAYLYASACQGMFPSSPYRMK